MPKREIDPGCCGLVRARDVRESDAPKSAKGRQGGGLPKSTVRRTSLAERMRAAAGERPEPEEE